MATLLEQINQHLDFLALDPDDRGRVAAVRALLGEHEETPDWNGPPSSCKSCGGTGIQYHGTGEDGHIWGPEGCHCDHNHCTKCFGCCDLDTGELQCESIKLAAEALGIGVGHAKPTADHVHTDECNHVLGVLPIPGASTCSHCGDHHDRTEYCPERCPVAYASLVENNTAGA